MRKKAKKAWFDRSFKDFMKENIEEGLLAEELESQMPEGCYY